MMRSSRPVLLSPPARWTARRCWNGCECTVFDPLLTQNPKKAGRAGRKQRKIRRASGGKKCKSEPKWLRFVRGTTYGPEGRGFESLTACHPEIIACCNDFGVFAPFFAKKVAYFQACQPGAFSKRKNLSNACLTLFTS